MEGNKEENIDFEKQGKVKGLKVPIIKFNGNEEAAEKIEERILKKKKITKKEQKKLLKELGVAVEKNIVEEIDKNGLKPAVEPEEKTAVIETKKPESKKEDEIKNITLAEFEDKYKDILGISLFNEKGDWIYIRDYNDKERYPVKLKAGVKGSKGDDKYFSLEELDNQLKVYRKKENPNPGDSDAETPEGELSDNERKIIDLYKGGALEMIKYIKGIDYVGKYGYEEKNIPVLIKMETERFWKKYGKIIKEDEKISEEKAQRIIEFIKNKF